MRKRVVRRYLLGYTGIATALFWAIWLLAGMLGWEPSLITVFGVPGLRIPAACAIAGLLAAAIGFWHE